MLLGMLMLLDSSWGLGLTTNATAENCLQIYIFLKRKKTSLLQKNSQKTHIGAFLIECAMDP
jgi:hypothetical protein